MCEREQSSRGREGKRKGASKVVALHICIHTVRNREMGTGISEASKRVPIFSFVTQEGKQVSSYF